MGIILGTIVVSIFFLWCICLIYISKKHPELILPRKSGGKQSTWYYILFVPCVLWNTEHFVRFKDIEETNKAVINGCYYGSCAMLSVATVLLLLLMI